MGKSDISGARSVASSAISGSFWIIGSYLKVYLDVFIKIMQEMLLLQHPTIKFEKTICWPTDDTNTCGSKVGSQSTIFNRTDHFESNGTGGSSWAQSAISGSGSKKSKASSFSKMGKSAINCTGSVTNRNNSAAFLSAAVLCQILGGHFGGRLISGRLKS